MSLIRSMNKDMLSMYVLLINGYFLGDRICSIGFFFFFQAEDGIRDYKVTGVQTCALPISGEVLGWFLRALGIADHALPTSVEERSALYRSRLRNQRVLVLLDNAADEAQVRDRKSVV